MSHEDECSGADAGAFFSLLLSITKSPGVEALFPRIYAFSIVILKHQVVEGLYLYLLTSHLKTL
jgi:hypothetical protein